MTSPSTPFSKSEDVILLLGRVALGAAFVKSGLQKLMALSAFAASLASRGIPHHLDDWGPLGGHDWPYWKHQMREYLSRI